MFVVTKMGIEKMIHGHTDHEERLHRFYKSKKSPSMINNLVPFADMER